MKKLSQSNIFTYPVILLAHLFARHYFLFFQSIFVSHYTDFIIAPCRAVHGNHWAGSALEEMILNAHERELPPMDLPPINYKEFLHEPYIPKPVPEPRFPVESASFDPSQPKQSQAEPSVSSLAFTELPVEMSFIALMGLETSRGSSDSAIKKLSEAAKAVVDVASIGQLLSEPSEEAAALQTVAEETISASA